MTQQLNHLATVKADKVFYAAHPELHGRKLTASPADAALRKEWLKDYHRALANKPKPPQPKVVPKPVAKSQPPSGPVQMCPYAKAKQQVVAAAPMTPMTFANFSDAVVQEFPEISAYVGKEVAKKAMEIAFTFLKYTDDLTMHDWYQFSSGYLQSPGYRSGINKLVEAQAGAASLDLVRGALADLAGSFAYWIAKRNGASDWVAVFDKQLTTSLSTVILLGPVLGLPAQAMQATSAIIESGIALTIENVTNFNQITNIYNQTADNADALGRQALTKDDRVTYERMLQISSWARQAKSDMYRNNPNIAAMSEVPNTIKNAEDNVVDNASSLLRLR